jgi:hypothetical protein
MTILRTLRKEIFMHQNININYGTNDFICVRNVKNPHYDIVVWKPSIIEKLFGITWETKTQKAINLLDEQISIVEKSR